MHNETLHSYNIRSGICFSGIFCEPGLVALKASTFGEKHEISSLMGKRKNIIMTITSDQEAKNETEKEGTNNHLCS